jgi:hypothetical protein
MSGLREKHTIFHVVILQRLTQHAIFHVVILRRLTQHTVLHGKHAITTSHAHSTQYSMSWYYNVSHSAQYFDISHSAYCEFRSHHMTTYTSYFAQTNFQLFGILYLCTCHSQMLCSLCALECPSLAVLRQSPPLLSTNACSLSTFELDSLTWAEKNISCGNAHLLLYSAGEVTKLDKLLPKNPGSHFSYST